MPAEGGARTYLRTSAEVGSVGRPPRPALALPRSRWASLVRAGYGTALICNPGAMIAARTGRRPSRRACAVGRVLGARHLAQAITCVVLPTRWLIRTGAAADVLHAASMLALAGEDADLRPALLTDAGIATAFATAGSAFLRWPGPGAS